MGDKKKGLSGGEKRRLAYASEVTKCSIEFSFFYIYLKMS